MQTGSVPRSPWSHFFALSHMQTCKALSPSNFALVNILSKTVIVLPESCEWHWQFSHDFLKKSLLLQQVDPEPTFDMLWQLDS